MSNPDDEILQELLIESKEHIANIEPDFLKLEQDPSVADDDMINRIFRAVHSIKGGFGFFGIANITKLSHSMENVLSRVRDKELTIDAVMIDVLLTGLDKLRVLLDDINNADSIEIDDEVNSLLPFLNASEKKTKSLKNIVKKETKLKTIKEDSDSFVTDVGSVLYSDISEQLIDFDEVAINGAIKNGQLVYFIKFNETDISTHLSLSDLKKNWSKVGQIIWDDISDNDVVSFLFISVLEPDLLLEKIKLNKGVVELVDISELRQSPSVVNENNNNTGADDKSKVKINIDAAEETLRVKLNLLNNLMDRAGELVLSRNQLLQTLNLPFNTTGESEKITDVIVAKVNSIFEKIPVASGDNSALQGYMENELQTLKNSIKEAFSFRMIDLHSLNAFVQNLDLITSGIQENIMLTRMQPISSVFNKFPRVIRDLAKKTGKKINLSLIGKEIELDKSIVELLSDPLTHLIRNCADHAIEMPSVRVKNGKDETGEVTLHAYHEGGKVNILIEDDGAGIDPQKIKAKALEKKVITPKEASEMSDKELQSLIFSPGFSTAKEVTDISGRGVGMDVVKTNIEKLGGTIELVSNPGFGSVFTMKLPLTLAIIPSLIVLANKRRFALPQVSLEEIVRIRAEEVTKRVENINGDELLRLRDKLLPLVSLSSLLDDKHVIVDKVTQEEIVDKRGRWSDRRNDLDEIGEITTKNKRTEKDRRKSFGNALKVVVLKLENNFFGLVVDDVLDSEEIVVKPLSEYIKSAKCYSGATIMGDGAVAMILDPTGIATMAALNFTQIEKEMEDKRAKEEEVINKKIESIFLFDNGSTEHFGIDLSTIARIEKRNEDEIEKVGNKEFLTYQDSSLRVIRLQDYLPVSRPAQEKKDIFILVPKGMETPFGIIISNVEDVVETEVNLDTSSFKADGISGSAIINSNFTLMLDLNRLSGSIN